MANDTHTDCGCPHGQQCEQKSDPIAELDQLLKEAGLRPTFDPERSIAKPCMICGTTDKPRDLVQIGTWTRPIGGHVVGDAIMRPMCADCEERTR